MAKLDIVVVGAPTGGMIALIELLKSIPTDFKASVFVVLHLPAYSQTGPVVPIL
jgi:two-component system chemotaxis response regulator CheB